MQKDPDICIDTKIVIECKEEKDVQTIFKTLNPDNKEFPEGLKMEVQYKQNTVFVESRIQR